MKRAIELAYKGKLNVSPNPRVGAVIVHDNKIIGEGFHQKYGEPHAEVNAIKAVVDKSQLADSTIFINLEPCAHYGKTPPCVHLIIKSGFKRVVIANRDPFDQVDGRGIEKLKNANIELELNCLTQKGRELNQRFFTFHEKKRPFIILKWAQTLDGFIGKDKNDQSNAWITNSVSKQLVHQWRAEEDAILVGKNTVLKDNPALTCREVEGKNPTRFVIDEQLELATTLHVFNNEASTFILNYKKSKTEGSNHYIKADFRNNLFDPLFKTCFENDIQSIIIEGGANILNQFISANLWDESRVFIGNKEFKNGILAPKLAIEPIEKIRIDDDQLLIYRQENNELPTS